MARRINKLIIDVQRDPKGTGLGKPEMLKGPLSGWPSRRINDEHRLIYRVRGTDLEIAACYGHYTDKWPHRHSTCEGRQKPGPPPGSASTRSCAPIGH